MVIGGILTHKSDYIPTKPSHVSSEGETEVAKWVHLAENHLRGDFLCEPLNIGGISKSICISLDKSNGHTQVFKWNLWWSDFAIPMLVLYWSVVWHREVFPQSVLSKIS